MPGFHRQSCRKRRRHIVQLYLDGLSQFEIAVWLDISQATVSRDLREAGRDPSNPDVRALRRADEAALAHLDRLEYSLWKMRDQAHKDFFTPRIVRNPRTGRVTETRWISGLPADEPRFFDWIQKCGQLRQRIQGRMDKHQLCGTIGIQKQIMRIEAAVKSLRQRSVEQVSQPAEARPDGSLQKKEGEQTAAPPLPPLPKGGSAPAMSAVAAIPTKRGERRGVSPPVSIQASHRSTRAKTRPTARLQASITRRSTGGLTSRRSPKGPIGRIDLQNYAKSLAGSLRQTCASQLVATKSAARRSPRVPRPPRMSNRRSRRPLIVRQRGPPHASGRRRLRFPLSAFRFCKAVAQRPRAPTAAYEPRIPCN